MTADTHQASILVVDDNPENRDLLVRHIQRQHHQALAVENGEQALEVLHSQPIDAVLLDLMMPGISGYEVLQAIKAEPALQCLPVVVVSALHEMESIEKCLELGADDYLVKPINRQLLKARITNCLAKKRHHDAEVAHHKEVELAKAELEALNARIEKSRDDLLSILHELDVGTVLINGKGKIVFMSRMAATLLHQVEEEVRGQGWEKVFALSKTDEAAVHAMLARPAANREKIPVHLNHASGKRFWVEIDIKNDPQDLERRIFVLYDKTEVHDLRLVLHQHSTFHDLIGKSEAMRVVYQQIQDVAPLDVSVLITGETGTGKELVARAIHTLSPRQTKPFVAINCAGLTETLLASQLFGHKKGAFTGATEDHQGLFEAANEGTLLLDEIGDMPLTIQATLLRALQEKEILRLGDSVSRKVNVRILAATHANLDEQVAAGTFRADLLYRIRVGRIHLPALKQRREDIPLLASAFLSQGRTTSGKTDVHEISREAMQLLMRYPWPGNVRELKSALDFSLIHAKGTRIEIGDLPPEIAHVDPTILLRETPEPDEKERILAILNYTNNNRTEAAKMLGMSRSTFYRRLVSLGIAREEEI